MATKEQFVGMGLDEKCRRGTLLKHKLLIAEIRPEGAFRLLGHFSSCIQNLSSEREQQQQEHQQQQNQWTLERVSKSACKGTEAFMDD